MQAAFIFVLRNCMNVLVKFVPKQRLGSSQKKWGAGFSYFNVFGWGLEVGLRLLSNAGGESDRNCLNESLEDFENSSW